MERNGNAAIVAELYGRAASITVASAISDLTRQRDRRFTSDPNVSVSAIDYSMSYVSVTRG
jgi:hypothetical protein